MSRNLSPEERQREQTWGIFNQLSRMNPQIQRDFAPFYRRHGIQLDALPAEKTEPEKPAQPSQ